MQAKSPWFIRLGCRWVAVASLVTAAACSVSQDREVAMGEKDAAKIESEVPVVHDTAVDRFVTELGRSMASRTRRADLDWHFTVVNSPEVNAFALPGGFVYVNRGAIEQAERLDELAGIMGHEIGHVVRRHGVEQMQKTRRGEVGLVLLCTLTRACSTIGGRVAVDVGANVKSRRSSRPTRPTRQESRPLGSRSPGSTPYPGLRSCATPPNFTPSRRASARFPPRRRRPQRIGSKAGRGRPRGALVGRRAS